MREPKTTVVLSRVETTKHDQTRRGHSKSQLSVSRTCLVTMTMSL
jgi:hypothetical protein